MLRINHDQNIRVCIAIKDSSLPLLLLYFYTITLLYIETHLFAFNNACSNTKFLTRLLIATTVVYTSDTSMNELQQDEPKSLAAINQNYLGNSALETEIKYFVYKV